MYQHYYWYFKYSITDSTRKQKPQKLKYLSKQLANFW